MDGDPRHAGVGGDLGDLSDIDRAFVPSGTHFDGEGDLDRSADFLEESPKANRILQPSRPTAIANHLLYRTAQIQIDEVSALLLHDPRRPGDGIRIGTEELNSDGLFLLAHRHELKGLFSAPDESFRGEQLRDNDL